MAADPARSPDDELELDDGALAHSRLPRQRTELPRKRDRRGTVRAAIALGLLLAGLVVATLLFWGARDLQDALGVELPQLTDPVDVALPAGLSAEHAMLFVDSTPPGATVLADGVPIGETPLAMDNPYSPGNAFELEVQKKGFRTHRQPATGGKTIQVRVKLQR